MCSAPRPDQCVFQIVFSSPQCKEKLGKPLPPQYALELLTVYAWERGNKQTDFSTAQGFQTVLLLVLKYQKLCIYWTKYYNFENAIIAKYLMRQLEKPRYSIYTGVSSLQKGAPPPAPYGRGTLETEEVGGLLT